MSEPLITALIALAGTVIGSFAGILTSSRLTMYRLERLEEKVEKHNHVIERVYRLEESVKNAHYRIEECRNEVGKLTGV